MNIGLIYDYCPEMSSFSKSIDNLDNSTILFHITSFHLLDRHLKKYPPDLLIVHDSFNRSHNLKALGNLSPEIETLFVLKDQPIFVLPAVYLSFHLIQANELHNHLQLAIQTITAGCHFYGPKIHNGMLKHREKADTPSDYHLTMREILCLNYFLSGKSYTEIAHEMGIKSNSVSEKLATICRKVNVAHPKEIIHFIRTKHWCNFESGEIIFF